VDIAPPVEISRDAFCPDEAGNARLFKALIDFDAIVCGLPTLFARSKVRTLPHLAESIVIATETIRLEISMGRPLAEIMFSGQRLLVMMRQLYQLGAGSRVDQGTLLASRLALNLAELIVAGLSASGR